MLLYVYNMYFYSYLNYGFRANVCFCWYGFISYENRKYNTFRTAINNNISSRFFFFCQHHIHNRLMQRTPTNHPNILRYKSGFTFFIYVYNYVYNVFSFLFSSISIEIFNKNFINNVSFSFSFKTKAIRVPKFILFTY